MSQTQKTWKALIQIYRQTDRYTVTQSDRQVVKLTDRQIYKPQKI